MTPVRLEPAAPRSRVKYSTTEPLRSHAIGWGVEKGVCTECLKVAFSCHFSNSPIFLFCLFVCLFVCLLVGWLVG